MLRRSRTDRHESHPRRRTDRSSLRRHRCSTKTLRHRLQMSAGLVSVAAGRLLPRRHCWKTRSTSIVCRLQRLRGPCSSTESPTRAPDHCERSHSPRFWPAGCKCPLIPLWSGGPRTSSHSSSCPARRRLPEWWTRQRRWRSTERQDCSWILRREPIDHLRRPEQEVDSRRRLAGVRRPEE